MPYGSFYVAKKGVYTQETRTVSGQLVSSYRGSSDALTVQTVTTGTVTAGYARLRKRAAGKVIASLLPENPYTKTVTTLSLPRVYMRACQSSDFRSTPVTINLGYQPGLSGIGPPDPTAYLVSAAEKAAADSYCIFEIRKRLKGAGPNLAVAFAERKQVVTMITETAKTIAAMLLSLRKGDLAKAAELVGVTVSKRQKSRHRSLHREWTEFEALSTRSSKRSSPRTVALLNKKFDKVMANGVLVTNYGWKPLLSDIDDAMRMLANQRYRAVRSTFSSKAGRTRDVRVLNIQNPNVFDSLVSGESSYLVKYNVKAGVGNDIAHTAAMVGISNPALVLWELTPWSFVIDWFLPIGNYLESLDATIGLDFIQGTKTTIEEVDVTQSGFVLGGTRYISSYGAHCSLDSVSGVKWKKINRVKLSGFPHPVLPTFKSPVTLVHCINAIALLDQQRHRSVKF